MCVVGRIMVLRVALQRVRARAAVHFERIFETVDVLVTPATATTAPVLDDATAASGMCPCLGLLYQAALT